MSKMVGGRCTLSVCLVLALTLFTVTVEGRRVKRRLDEFAKMIEITCDRNPLDFNGYGNYCGLGGKGVPVDKIDKCCQTHDGCYVHVNRNECKTVLKYKVYTTDYRWQTSGGNITCRDTEECPLAICECDRAAAICFGEYNNQYNTDNKHSAILRGLSKLLHMSR